MPAGLVGIFTISGIDSFHLTANFFFLSLSLAGYITFHNFLHLSYKSATFFTQTERERVDSESRCFLLTTISLITLFAFLWYSLSLSLSLSLSILIMVKNWIEMRGFPNKDFAILMFEILLFARFFFLFFF